MKKLVILLLIISISGCAKKEFKFETLNQPIEIEYLTEADNTGQKYVIETNGEIEEFSGIDTYPLGLQTAEYKVEFEGNEKIIPVEFKVVLSESLDDYKDVLPSGRYYKRLDENGVPVYLRVDLNQEKLELLTYPFSKYDFAEDYDTTLVKESATRSTYGQMGEGDLAVYYITEEAIYWVQGNSSNYATIENEIEDGDYSNIIMKYDFEYMLNK
ncbi:hypothetical protein [Anaerorhabdus furcosa]|uniref:Lipoprotein n=1 Tax=Anaerorhabdus furcosa TaxID=118967 RepID=A0A1T4LEM4_9FIRM|nr:hypothetical protein [Anaerorhabdus furcosa]SJZ53066.1 hypothetical protein SAMN02745191_0850 [Anaerorhabdus furcosa]